jgi:hypothetical protein
MLGGQLSDLPTELRVDGSVVDKKRLHVLASERGRDGGQLVRPVDEQGINVTCCNCAWAIKSLNATENG